MGDAFAGRRLGFGRRRGALAAGFAVRRGGDANAAVASWIAGALAETGLIAVTLAPDASPQARALALADAPFHGARFVGRIAGLPGRPADVVRWHREHHDGTGVPDRLRWDGIPADAAALGIVHAFLEALEDPAESRDPGEALFAVAAESGRRFKVELVRAFRDFVLSAGDGWETPPDVALPAPDDDALLSVLAAELDARDPSTRARSERLAEAAAALAARLGLDTGRAARLARLLALGRAAEAVEQDDADPLSQLARERREAAVRRAAAIAGSVPAYAGDAALLTASAAWFEDGAQDRLAAVVGLVAAAAGLPPADAAHRVGAAAGTQFDPVVADAYVAGLRTRT